MSLVRQVWLLVLCTTLLAFAGSLIITFEPAKAYEQARLNLKNAESASSIALALSRQKGNKTAMNQVLEAQFDTGAYRRIRWLAIDGSQLFVREANAEPINAPAWFVWLAPIESIPGTAQVSDGVRSLGEIEVVSHTSNAHDELWKTTTNVVWALLLLTMVIAAMGLWLVTRIRESLELTLKQAHALGAGELVMVTEPQVPELRRITRAMNSMVARLRKSFQVQTEQLESLRRQANCDYLTGLSNRTHFFCQMAAALEREDGTTRGGLVLLRVLDLAGMNRIMGHADANRLILFVVAALKPYAERVQGCFLGRLNGSDFALCLPVAGVAREVAESLAHSLKLAWPDFGPGICIGVSLGAVEMRRDMTPGEVMGSADDALARAESRGAFAVELGTEVDAGAAMLGEGSWRQNICEALVDGRVRLVSFPVVDSRNELVHLECPLRMQFEVDGIFDSAARWLPLAIRSQLTVAIDERALALALLESARDGKPRCVNLSPASLSDSSLVVRLRALLWQAPRVTRLISLEVAEIAAVEHFELLRELSRQLRPIGVRLGLEHAGELLGHIPRLFEAGLDFVKLDASMVRGVGRDESRAAYVRSTVTMLHGLSLQVYAEGVVDEEDALQLWECGVDAATGPWISQQQGA